MIHISRPAFYCFKKDFDLKKGESVRFFPQYGGWNQLVEGFSLGVRIEKEKNPSVSKEIESVTFFIEEDDGWILTEKDLHITHKRKKDEITFSLQ